MPTTGQIARDYGLIGVDQELRARRAKLRDWQLAGGTGCEWCGEPVPPLPAIQWQDANGSPMAYCSERCAYAAGWRNDDA